MMEVIKKYANPGSERVMRLVAKGVRNEKWALNRHKRRFMLSSVGLAALAVVEYTIGYGFISYMLADNSEHPAVAPLVAMIVPIAGFTYFYMTEYEGEEKLANWIRKFAIAGIMILPVALSLGLAVTMANSIGGDIALESGNTFLGGEPAADQGAGFFSDVALGVLNGISPMLVVAGFGSALAISFYAAHLAMKSIVKHFGFIDGAVDRYPVVKPLIEKFQAGNRRFKKLFRRKKKEVSKLPPHLRETFADELYEKVNKRISILKREVQMYPFNEGDKDLLTPLTPPRIFIPYDIETREAAIKRLAEIRDALRQYRVVEALNAAPPKEEV